jgi:hypothetical protein
MSDLAKLVQVIMRFPTIKLPRTYLVLTVVMSQQNSINDKDLCICSMGHKSVVK